MTEHWESTRDRAKGRARRALADIRATWDTAANPPRVSGPTTRSVPGSRPPVPLDRADTIRVLTWWARRTLRRDHTLTLTRAGRRPAWDNLDELLDFVNEHLDLIAAEHDGANLPSLIADLERCARNLERLTDPYPQLKIGDCHLTANGETPGPDNVHTGMCQGTVYADPAADDATRYHYATCDTCRSEAAITWWRQQWEPAPPELVTTTRLVKLLAAQGIHTTEATMRWRLHKGLVSRSGTTKSGDSLWDVTAVVYALTRTSSGSVGPQGTPMPETRSA